MGDEMVDGLADEVIISQVQAALAEDVGLGDATAALLPADQTATAIIVSREPMLLCGQAWVEETLRQVEPTIHIQWAFVEGVWIETGAVLCRLQGPVRGILTAERTALNFLQTLSATATHTYLSCQQLKASHTKLLDTRKTLPGLRFAQKYAVRCGGGMNHRMGLYDAYLIKENHIKACGSITAAIQTARELNPTLFLEVEVESLVELQEALLARPDRIMLDNFDLPMIDKAVVLAKPYGIAVEVSGGVDKDHLVAIAKTGVDYISMGCLTKSVHAIDLSLQLTSTI